MGIKKYMVAMGVVSLAVLGTSSVGLANEIDKLTENDSNQKHTVQNTEGSSQKGTANGTNKSNGSSGSSNSNKGYGTTEPPKSPVSGDLYDNEGDSANVDDTIDSVRKALPKARQNDVLNQVQSALNKGKADAGNTARWISKPINKWIMVIISVILDIIGGLFLLSTIISLLYAVAPPLRFLFDDDDVAQRNLQMARANQGMSDPGAKPQGAWEIIKSFFKVDDDMIQAMIEGNLMQGANNNAGMVMAGGYGGGYGGQGAAFGGGFGGQQPRQALQSAPRAGKHVLATYMKKRFVTLIFLVLFMTVFFSSLAFDYAGNIVEFIVRVFDLIMNGIKSI